MPSGPIVLIGLDAADIRRIERLSAAGSTPNLARFQAHGARGRLCSRPTGLSATIWPKWFEGGQVGTWYFPKQWNPDRMCLEWITATRGDPEPFWSDLDRRGLRVCIVDVPQAAPVPLRHGVALQGWQVHDLFDRWSTPGNLWGQLTRQHGPPHLGTENYGAQTVTSLLALREQLLAATRQAGEIARDLMDRGPFDLFVMILGALHRGGHYLWDTSQVDLLGAGRDEVMRLESALDEIYIAADHAVGQIMDGAAPDVRVLLFALHGMQANGGWSERFQSIARAVANLDAAPNLPTPLQRLRRRMPAKLAQRALSLVPDWVSSRLLMYTSRRMHDWPHTPWFVLPSDLAGFIRLNLKGRESQGILEPGAEAREMEDRLIATFSELSDLEGRRIVDCIERTDDLVESTDPNRRFLPDLFLNWGSVKASETSGLRLDGRELQRWAPGQANDSGRSGNHATEGWYSAMGPGIEPEEIGALREIDGIVPTIYQWLGMQPPAAFNGEPLMRDAPTLRSET